MASYSEKFKERMVRRLVGPNAISANQLADEVGISQSTLSRWARKHASLPVMSGGDDEAPSKGPGAEARRPRDWPPAERLAIVLEARTIAEADLGAFLRRKGLHEADLNEWRRVVLEAAESALAGKTSKKPSGPEDKRVKDLEREVKGLQDDLRRKEKALAEVTALLVLKKKMDLLLGRDVDDDEPGKNGK